MLYQSLIGMCGAMATLALLALEATTSYMSSANPLQSQLSKRFCFMPVCIPA